MSDTNSGPRLPGKDCAARSAVARRAQGDSWKRNSVFFQIWRRMQPGCLKGKWNFCFSLEATVIYLVSSRTREARGSGLTAAKPEILLSGETTAFLRCGAVRSAVFNGPRGSPVARKNVLVGTAWSARGVGWTGLRWDLRPAQGRSFTHGLLSSESSWSLPGPCM